MYKRQVPAQVETVSSFVPVEDGGNLYILRQVHTNRGVYLQGEMCIRDRDVRVIRLPRHGASCPVGLGVSCSADRNAKAKITPEGIFIEPVSYTHLDVYKRQPSG